MDQLNRLLRPGLFQTRPAKGCGTNCTPQAPVRTTTQQTKRCNLPKPTQTCYQHVVEGSEKCTIQNQKYTKECNVQVRTVAKPVTTITRTVTTNCDEGSWKKVDSCYKPTPMPTPKPSCNKCNEKPQRQRQYQPMPNVEVGNANMKFDANVNAEMSANRDGINAQFNANVGAEANVDDLKMTYPRGDDDYDAVEKGHRGRRHGGRGRPGRRPGRGGYRRRRRYIPGRYRRPYYPVRGCRTCPYRPYPTWYYIRGDNDNTDTTETTNTNTTETSRTEASDYSQDSETSYEYRRRPYNHDVRVSDRMTCPQKDTVRRCDRYGYVPKCTPFGVGNRLVY